MPGIGDPRFERALILICAHDEGHAMGLAVNRPVDGLTVGEILEKLGVKSESEATGLVLLGGPVQTERGFVLHTGDYHAEHSLDIGLEHGAGIALTATRDVLEAMAGGTATPRRATLALGYAGWGGGQLEHELRNNAWLTCAADEALIFDTDHETKWGRALAKLGIDPDRLSFAAGQA